MSDGECWEKRSRGNSYLEVDGQVKGEAEEADDDKVDQADGDGGDDLVGVEGAEVVLTEADGRAQGLRGGQLRSTLEQMGVF